MDRAIEGLTSESFLMDRPVRRAIEENPGLRLELADDLGCVGDQRPGKFLIVEVRAAFERIDEVAFDRIAGLEHRVEPALHQTRATALPDQALRDHDDVEIRIRIVCVQGGHEARSAASDDQHVARERLDGLVRLPHPRGTPSFS